ncbi:MAG: HPP family protein [Candidatus Lokiarchaeia archaeon]
MISLRVKDVYSEEMYSLIVEKGTSVEEVIKSFAEKPTLRGIFVVDEEKKLIGVITRHDLIIWAKLMTGVPEARSMDDFLNISRVSRSKTAVEMIRKETKKAAVSPDDNINVALNKMLSLELVDVPVVDEKSRVVGDIQLSKILKIILEKGPKKPK